MKYTRYGKRIDCEDDKCGEWHYQGHEINELLPGDILVDDDGKKLCIGCGGAQGPHEFCRPRLAVRMVESFGMIDGAHHKQWIIDQIMRVLLDNEYEDWVKKMNSDPEYEPWDQGIAP